MTPPPPPPPKLGPTTRQVLELLQTSAGANLSGQEMCRRLGISRTAVWKHINLLRRNGYQVEAHPRRGYRLAERPNRPLAAEVESRLRTSRLGRPLTYLASLDSTNRRLLALAEQGAPEGTLIVAETQTGGRGRLSRSWFSPPGVNLYLSLLLRPAVPPLRVPSLALAVGLAVRRAVARLAPELEVQVKWPNDLFLGGRKLAGILCEMRSELDRVHYVVAGIGLNVNLLEAELPPELRGRATSLRIAAGHEWSRPELLATLLEELEPVYDQWQRAGLAPFLPELERHAYLQGREVTVDFGAEQLRGRVAGLAASGALILELPGGRRREVLSGDVFLSAIGAAP